MSKYKVLKVLPLSFLETLDLSSTTDERVYSVYDGIDFFYYPEKIKNYLRSCTCIACGMVGSEVRIEKGKGTHRVWSNAHLNVYAKRNTFWGDYTVQLTVDHDILKSNGGPNIAENYNTMCEYCNKKRGSKYENLEDYLHSLKEPEMIVLERARRDFAVKTDTLRAKIKLENKGKNSEYWIQKKAEFLEHSHHAHVGDYNRHIKKLKKSLTA